MDIASLLNTPPISPCCFSEESDKTSVQIKPQSTGTTWSLDEATLAAKLKAQGKSWDDISCALPGRTAHACSEYDRRNNPLDHRRRWSPEDIELLVTLVRDEKPWTEISHKLGRGIGACRVRYRRLTGARNLVRERDNRVNFVPQQGYMEKPSFISQEVSSHLSLSVHKRSPPQLQGDHQSRRNSPGFAATSPVFSPGPLKLTLEEEQADNAYWDDYFNKPKPEPTQESFNQWWERLFQKQEDKQNAEGDKELFSSAKTSSIVRSKTSTDLLHEPTPDMARTRFNHAENGYKLDPWYLQTLNWARNHAIQMSPVLNPVLRDRLTHEQARRSKRLDEMKQAHANAILQGKCRSGKYCCAWHSHVDVYSGYKTGLPPVQGQSVAKEHLAGTVHPLLSVNTFPAEFECPLCFNVKKIRTPSDWTKHLFEDIQPFICTFPDCANPGPFKRKADWIRHENERHRQLKYWECSLPGCDYKAYRKDNFVQHLVQPNSRYPMHDPTRQVNEVSELVESCSHKTTKNPQEEPCRFCDEIFIDWTRLIKHLGEHLEDIALRALR